MDTRKLLKLAPTLIMVAVMGYATYSGQPAAPSTAEARTAKSKQAGTGAGAVDSLIDPDAGKADDLAHRNLGRNPFLVVVKPAADGHGKGGEGWSAASDPYRALLQQMTLNATFIQGSVQYASINGRLYRRGEQLDGLDGAHSGLLIVQVTPAEVVLEAEGTHYTLAYPEQFTASSARARGPGRTNPTTGRAGAQGRPPMRIPRFSLPSPAPR
jgi:hypothetical protein